MTVEERVVKVLRGLSDRRQQEVLNFVEFLQMREQPTESTTAESKKLRDKTSRLIRKDDVLVIETQPLGSVNVNQFINDLREERIQK